jgi:hypothetical protein
MHRIPRLRYNAFEQMPIPRKQEHLRKMHRPLLPTRHERKSKENHALLWTTNDTASPRIGVASPMGRPQETTNPWQTILIKGVAAMGQVFC